MNRFANFNIGQMALLDMNETITGTAAPWQGLIIPSDATYRTAYNHSHDGPVVLVSKNVSISFSF